MPRSRVFSASADKHRTSWLGRLTALAEMGTGDYPPLIRRRLMIVNMMAYLIAIFSLFYAALFAASILSLSDESVRARLRGYRSEQSARIDTLPG